MRSLLRPRNLLIAFLVLVGLAVAAVFVAREMAEARVERELIERADRLGWTLSVAEVEVSFSGAVVVRGLDATDAHGGRVRLERLETHLTVHEFLDGRRVPREVELHGLDAFVTRAGLESLAERARSERASGGGGADDDGGDGKRGGPPQVRVHGAQLAVASGTELGVVRLVGVDAALINDLRDESEGRTWSLGGTATLELDTRHAVRFALNAVPSRRWGHVRLSFEEPLEVRRAGYGTVSLGALELAGDGASISGNLQRLGLAPEVALGLEELEIAQVDLSLSRRADGSWWPASLRVVEPQATVDLGAVLEGPLGRRYPRLVEVAEAASLHLTGERLPLRPASRSPARLPGAPVALAPGSGGARAVGGEGAAAGSEQWLALLHELPGIVVEEGALELVLGERRARVRGLGFDTRALRDAAQSGRSIAFGLNLRGARADLRLDVPQDGSWPSGAVHVRNLSAADLFAVADLRPPRELAGELDFDLDVQRSEAGELVVHGGVALRGFGFFHPKVSTRALRNVDAALTGTVRYDFARDELRLEEVAATSGPMTAYAEIVVGALRRDPDIRFRFYGDGLACEDIPAALPEGLLPTIEHFAVAPGRFSPRIEGRLRWSQPHSFEFAVSDLPGACRVQSVAPHDVAALNSPSYTFTFRGLPYTWKAEGVAVGPGTRDWVPLDELPGYVPAAMFLTEDKRFFDHGGLRLGLIERAVKLNLEHRRYVYGGSSISQQLVKNLFLTRTKTMARKLEEVLIVWAMEAAVPKQRILELYVNCIEFGPDVYGVTQAARFYFDKRPQELTPLEAGYLASLKVAPRRGGKHYKSGFPGWGRWWHKRQRYIQVTLSENGYISPAEAVAGYPFMPPFDHPTPGDARDPRNEWLQRHGGRPFDE